MCEDRERRGGRSEPAIIRRLYQRFVNEPNLSRISGPVAVSRRSASPIRIEICDGEGEGLIRDPMRTSSDFVAPRTSSPLPDSLPIGAPFRLRHPRTLRRTMRSSIGQPPKDKADAEHQHGDVFDYIPAERLRSRLSIDRSVTAANSAGADGAPQIVSNPNPEHEREKCRDWLHDVR